MRAVLGVVAVVASAAIVGSASAKPIFNESYHFEGSEVIDNFCVDGVTVRGEFVVDGRVRAASHGPDGLAYFLEHTQETEALTNLATGQSLTRTETGASSKDLRVTDNGDGTLTILSRVVGNDVLYGSDGKAIWRNPGQSRFELLIDDGGTPTDPFDDEFIDGQRVKGSTGRNDDFCAAIIAAWGY